MPNQSRRPPGLPGGAHERTPEERTAEQVMRDARHSPARDSRIRPDMIPYPVHEALMHEPIFREMVRSPAEMERMQHVLRESRYADDGMGSNWTTARPFRIDPTIHEDVVSDSVKRNQPADVVEAAVNSFGHKAMDRFTLVSHTENPSPYLQRNTWNTRYGVEPAKEQEFQQYLINEQKRKLAIEVGARVIEKCNPTVNVDYNHGVQRMSNEAVVFSRAEFEAFLRDMTANVVESIRVKGYIK